MDKAKMTDKDTNAKEYNIKRILIKNGNRKQVYVNHTTRNLKAYRDAAKRKYDAEKIYLIYKERNIRTCTDIKRAKNFTQKEAIEFEREIKINNYGKSREK